MNSNMPRCGTCKFRNELKVCTNDNLTEGYFRLDDIDDMLVYSYQEGGCFYVGENFGCVHHEEKQANNGEV